MRHADVVRKQHQLPLVIEEEEDEEEEDNDTVEHLPPEVHVPVDMKNNAHKYYFPGQYPGSVAHLKIEQPNQPIMVHVVPPGTRRKQESTIPDLLAVLAPLAAIPLIGSLAVSSFTTMLTLTGLGRRRRKREVSIHERVISQLNLPGLASSTGHNNQFSLANFTQSELIATQSKYFGDNHNLSSLYANDEHGSPAGTSSSFSQDLPIFQAQYSSESGTNKSSVWAINKGFKCHITMFHYRRIQYRSCSSWTWCNSTCVNRVGPITMIKS